MDSQLAYQQAFLQNAVAQNMQIQQQLMMQNQALNQMLAQTSTSVARVSGDKSMSPRHEDASPTRSQQRKLDPVYFGMTEAHRRASESQLTRHHDDHDLFDPKLISKTEPNTPRHSTTVPPQAPTLSALDAYGRAKTVRIGKWRWPPAKEDMDGNTEGFFEFKMRKNMKTKDGGTEGHQDQLHDSFDDPSDEIQGLDWGDQDNEEFNKGLKRSQSKDSFTIMDDSQDNGAALRPRLESPVAAHAQTGGNVGKLKISSEMKEKLEAAMGSRKSSVRENSRERAGLEGINGEEGVKKLNENRKMILEQKLGGGKLKKWENIDQELQHKSVDTETASRKSSHNSQSGHIPVPPPPPIAPSFTRPLHVSTDNNESTSLVSSYYSPGNTHHRMFTFYREKTKH